MITPDREFSDIDSYRRALVGKTIMRVDFEKDADEGLMITCDDGVKLRFGFSALEGTIAVEEDL